MNILSPLDRADEVEDLVKAGADEFYCGAISKEWKRKYTAVASTNRREWFSNNFKNFDELEKAVSIAHSHKKPVFLTMNSHFYTNKQYPLLYKDIKRAMEIGVDAFIVADIALMLTLKKLGADIHASTGCAVTNSEAARFFLELGVSRIVLPRHLTIEEMRDIVENAPDLKFHVFIFNEGCFNMDGLCTFHHGFGSQEWNERVLGCSIPYDVRILERTVKERTIKHRIRNLTKNLLLNCGACSLYELNKMNIHSLKIIGRGNPKSKKVKDVIFFRELLGEIGKSKSKEEFQEKAKALYEKSYSHTCTYRNCYY